MYKLEKDRGYALEYLGPGLWMYSLFSLCNINPNGDDRFEDHVYNDGRGYMGTIEDG